MKKYQCKFKVEVDGNLKLGKPSKYFADDV